MKWYFHSESMNKELEVKAIFLDTNKFMVQLNGWGTECLYGADKLLQAHDDAVRRECDHDRLTLAEKLRQYLPHCGKQDMTNGDRELVEWVDSILGKEAEK